MPSRLAGLATLFCVLLYIVFRPRKQRLPSGTELPDGPRGKPLLGNLLDIPPFHSWLKFEAWSKRYGPLFRLDIAGRNHIIVSTEEIANDLLRERGTIYSDREQLPMAAQLVSRGFAPLFMPYGETWRNVRKLMHNLINVSVAQSYEVVQEEESLRAVRDLINNPRKYETWFERYSAGLILRLAYSKRVYTGEEPFVRRILAAVHTVERVASPGAYLVDTIPALMYLPSWLAPFKREGAKLHAEELDLFRTCLHEGIEASLEDPNTANFCGKWYHNKDSYGLSEDLAAYAIGTLFGAGAGTTASAMMSFMLAATLHPLEFKKLQSELDEQIGAERLPNFNDMPQLPRVRAFAKETLRWRPVTAGGIPHMLTKDDVYKMPDGRSLFLAADPESFVPDSWLKEGWPTYREPLTQYPNLQNYSAFGFGRRICPGQNLAERSLNILIARIAWACDISQERDAQGNAIAPPDYDYITGFNVQPKPFKFELKARQGREKVLESLHTQVWGG